MWPFAAQSVAAGRVTTAQSRAKISACDSTSFSTSVLFCSVLFLSSDLAHIIWNSSRFIAFYTFRGSADRMYTMYSEM